jgi:hypothetical protein
MSTAQSCWVGRKRAAHSANDAFDANPIFRTALRRLNDRLWPRCRLGLPRSISAVGPCPWRNALRFSALQLCPIGIYG